jgi:penicillin G amidase
MFILLFLLTLKTSFATSLENCKAQYDQLGISHVETTSEREFYYCFGYFHGKDRAWEMDHFKRVALGTTSELYGFSHLKNDLMMRFLDLKSESEKLWANFPEDKKKILESYARGVNAGFKIGRGSVEFKYLNHIPDPWLPQDSLLILLLQSFDQTKKTFLTEYEEQLWLEKHGEKTKQLFDHDLIPWEKTILKMADSKNTTSVDQDVHERSFKMKLWGDFPKFFGEETGSNNWAISKQKSHSGFSMLANDPHLDLKTPMFWYWIHLKSPGIDAIGASLPGIPMMAAGTNGKVAWGLTNSYYNAADLFHISDLTEEDVITFRPWVFVKLGFLKWPFFFKSFERLKSGHRILPLKTKSAEKIVLRWSGFSLKPDDVIPLFDFIHAQNVEKMDHLASKVGVPSWNLVFADAAGEIGYRLLGKVYKQVSKTPFGISTIKKDQLQIENFLAPNERPFIKKPSEGFISTANNRHWPVGATFYGGRSYAQSFRALRIQNQLEEKMDIEKMKSLQCDQFAMDAKFFVNLLQKSLVIPELEGWDFKIHDSSRSLAIYRRLMDLLLGAFDVNEYALYRILLNPDKDQVEVMKKNLKLARDEVKGRTWGELHKVNFPHMSMQTHWKMSPEINGVGDTHSVNPGSAKWNEERGLYEQSSGASMRMIVELKETPVIWLTLPGANRHYSRALGEGHWRNWKECIYTKIDLKISDHNINQ